MEIQKLFDCCQNVIKEYNISGNFEEAKTLNNVEMLCRVYKHIFNENPRVPEGNRSGLIVLGAEVDIHYWRNWDRDYETIGKRKKQWSEIQKIFDRQFAGKSSNQSRRIMITFWCSEEKWKNLHPFGAAPGRGSKKVNKNKLDYFPFVVGDLSDTLSLVTDYQKRDRTIFQKDKKSGIRCILLGEETDILNAAIYF